ncbi:MAG: protein translocase subunit SecD [Bacilli bacterium]|nr:protein translocase subunit SecD [Bacilli bacterium]
MTKKKNNKKIGFSSAILTILLVLIISVVGVYFAIKNLNFGLDLQGGFEVLYEVNSIDGSKVTNDMVNSTYKIIEKRINALGVSEPEIAIEGNNIRVTMAGIDNIDDARKTISTTAALTFRTVDGELLMDSSVLNSGKASVGYETNKGYYISLSVKDYDEFYEQTKKVSEMDTNQIVIWLDYEEGLELELVENGYGYYETVELTNENDEKEEQKIFYACGDLVNSKCLSVAGVDQGFASDVIIQGDFTNEEAQGLVDLINSGSMPTKLTEISSKTVSASFGENSLDKTFTAGVVGIAAITLLLIILYRVSGVVASVSILAYTFLTLLIFNLVGGRLSLQGIAALVIGIGMAVDSAVISFARIKEELTRKVSLRTAYEKGSKESFVSILDANVTTLIAAIILFIFGESSVKGFATMLIISIIVTFIVMVYLNRYLIKLFVKSEKFEKHTKAFIGYKEKKNKTKFDFVKPRNIIFIVVGLIILVGCMFTYSEGLNLGIDFKGGSTIEINSNDKLKLKDVEKDLEELEYKVEKVEQLDDSRVYVTIDNVLDNEETTKVEEYFNKKYDATTSVVAISNQVKKDITANAIKALIYACIGMIIYITIRFKFSYGVSAIIALVHDSLMVLILFSLLRLEVNSMFIAAILSIIGYSINNTIVVFDRIRENKTKLYKDKIKNINELKEIVNVSLRQTVVRCIITTITTLLPVISLIFLGSHEIINFNIALLFGLVIGTFSSLFISSQIWMLIEKRRIGKDPNKHWYDDNKKEKEELQIKGINC